MIIQHTIESRETDPGNRFNDDRDVVVSDYGEYFIIGFKEFRRGGGVISKNISRKAAEELLVALDLMLTEEEAVVEDHKRIETLMRRPSSL